MSEQSDFQPEFHSCATGCPPMYVIKKEVTYVATTQPKTPMCYTQHAMQRNALHEKGKKKTPPQRLHPAILIYIPYTIRSSGPQQTDRPENGRTTKRPLPPSPLLDSHSNLPAPKRPETAFFWPSTPLHFLFSRRRSASATAARRSFSRAK